MKSLVVLRSGYATCTNTPEAAPSMLGERPCQALIMSPRFKTTALATVDTVYVERAAESCRPERPI
jgi:hypothetical protein